MAKSPLSHKLLCPECGEIFDEGDIEHCPDDGSTLTQFVVDNEPDTDPLIGEVLDERFVIEDVLGEGSMGRVYRATQTSVDRSVAVKTVHPHHATDEKTVKRFHREARAISEFSHPNIVKLVDFGQDLERGTLYLAMEYIDGYPVRVLISRGRLAPALAVHFAVQIAGALAEVHSHDLVHRDLKPENLMIVPLADGRVEVKLLDFGIAHALRQSQNLTETGAVFGTPHFLSPEQAEAGEVGPYSDVYSLGAVLFAMLTGRHPVDAEDPMEVMVGHVQGRIPSVEEVLGPGEVSDHLNWLVGNMLSTRPEERPGDILRVRDVLKTIASLEEYETPEVDPSLPREAMFEPYLLDADDHSPDPVSTAERTSASPEEGEKGESDQEEEASEGSADEQESSAESTHPPPETFAPPPESSEETSSGGNAGAEQEGTGDSPPSNSAPADADSRAADWGDETTVAGDLDQKGRISVGPFAVVAALIVAVGIAVALFFAFGGETDVEPEPENNEASNSTKTAPSESDSREENRDRDRR